MTYYRQIKERPENAEMQRYIRGRALYSLAILGKSFIIHGSGRFLNLRPPTKEELEAKTA